ncbi:hypothetical protein [Seonamhaeicola sp. ML3]|uniref:hypothetical protein n=1 Tax=Seonamhaeicola sp. ML3 TaxID=2937786 RepID=UPI00200CBEF0|nr:hypothetical protein [Seonamhaeicola sp. ML3]
MKKLNNSQVNSLYQFTQSHFVEHYDVQTELVNHLANDIEEVWLKEPDLPFEKAKQRSFEKFGVFGFMDIVEQRKKAMNKLYIKHLL